MFSVQLRIVSAEGIPADHAGQVTSFIEKTVSKVPY